MGIATGERPVNAKQKQIGKVWVDVWRNDDAGANIRPLVLMIHGMFGGGWYFESWAKFLCEKCFTVYIIKDLHEGEDLRKVDFYTYLEKTTKVIMEICATERGKIILFGHSMGGLIAQKIAKTKPDFVAGIVLVASAPPKGISAMSWSVTKAMSKHWFSLTFNLPLKIDRKSAFKLILNWHGNNDKKERIFQKFVPESARVARQLAFSKIPINERKISCKSLVVAGSCDKLLSPEIQIKIFQKYNSNLCLFRKGHMLMLEDHNDEIIGAIYRWIILNFSCSSKLNPN